MGNLTRENIVDNITLYWLTGTAASAARSYWEDARALAAALASGQPPPPVSVPVGFTTFPGEIWATPRSWAEAVYPGIAYFNEVDRGGHFAAWEEPSSSPTELRACVPRRCAGEMSILSPRRPMPSLDGAVEWLNSEPLDRTDLRGRAVLVDVWTLTCINWLRTAPYVHAWWNAYRDDGLTVIGVHTPEFSFEHDVERVRRATVAAGSTTRSPSTPTSRSGTRSTTTTGRLCTSSTARA